MLYLLNELSHLPAPELYRPAGPTRDVICMSACKNLKLSLTNMSNPSDPGNPRTLSAATYGDGTAMTDESCVNFCKGKGFIYAGVEYAQECCKSSHLYRYRQIVRWEGTN